MTTYYDVMHNTAYHPRLPEIQTILIGIEELGDCTTCGVTKRSPRGSLTVVLGEKRLTKWPDMLACGDYPCCVVSHRFVAAMGRDNIRLVLGGEVRFATVPDLGPLDKEIPDYYWIDGPRHFAGTMDFEASGVVGVKFCEECGVRSSNIGLTYDRQHSSPPPVMTFNLPSNNPWDLFTTDLSPTAFFCTDKVVKCAVSNRLTNIGFTPAERGLSGTPLSKRELIQLVKGWQSSIASLTKGA